MNGDQPVFIEVDRIVALHDAAMRAHGGNPGPPRVGCIEGAVGNAVSASLYSTDRAEPDALTVAAYAFCYLVRDHCFSDGNKRTAWLVLVELLRVHLGVQVSCTDDQAFELVEAVVTGRKKVEDVLGWLAEPGRLEEPQPS